MQMKKSILFVLLCAAVVLASCNEDDTNPSVPVAGVMLNHKTLLLGKGETASLVATVTPEDAGTRVVTWASSDKAVAEVSDQGVVTAKAIGDATITVTTLEGGFEDVCQVTVLDTDTSDALVTFDNPTAVIKENGGVLTVPFHMNKALASDVTVIFAQGTDDRQTARQRIHFDFPDGKDRVILPRGTRTGTVDLQIIDNDYCDGNVYFDLAIRQVDGAQRGLDSICKVTIEDEDIDRTVRIGQPAGDGTWAEEAGTIEIPLIFENGEWPERMISGKIAIRDLVGCTQDDVTLETTSFETAGNETLKVKVRLRDNETFGDWSFRLDLQDLVQVRLVGDDVIHVRDDERILGFAQAAYEVDEGSSVNLSTMLKGGGARSNVPIRIEVVADQTTATPDLYTLPASYDDIAAQGDASSFVLRANKSAALRDVVLVLKVSSTAGASTPGKILYDDTQTCRVTIRNTDSFVRFAATTLTGVAAPGVYDIALETSGYDEAMVVYVEASSATTMSAGSFSIRQKFVTFSAGAKSGRIQLELSEALKADEQIVIEITRVLGESGMMNDEVDPDAKAIVCRN